MRYSPIRGPDDLSGKLESGCLLIIHFEQDSYYMAFSFAREGHGEI